MDYVAFSVRGTLYAVPFTKVSRIVTSDRSVFQDTSLYAMDSLVDVPVFPVPGSKSYTEYAYALLLENWAGDSFILPADTIYGVLEQDEIEEISLPALFPRQRLPFLLSVLNLKSSGTLFWRLDCDCLCSEAEKEAVPDGRN